MRRTRMNRRGLWAACVVLLVGVGVVAVGAGFAEDKNAGATCSQATLHGTYPFAIDGVEIMGNNDQDPFATAAYGVLDGKGKEKSFFSSNVNGEVSRTEH